MPLSIQTITPPTAEPITLLEARQHLRVDIDDDNDLISGLISAARGYIETRTRRQFMQATLRLTLDGFMNHPSLVHGYRHERTWERGRVCRDHAIELPSPPLQSVASITYYDAAGILQTLDPSTYLVDTQSEPGRIVAAYGLAWPTALCQINAVAVTYVAGWPNAASVPAGLKSAIKMMVGHWYDNREAVVIGQGNSAVLAPLSVDSLVSSFEVPVYY